MQKITPRQIVLLGVTYIINIALVHVPSQMANYAKQHAYLTLFPAVIVVTLMLFLLTRSAKRFPGKDLFQSLTSRYKVIGRVIGFLYLLFFFGILVRDVRTLAEFTNVVLLPLTPIFIISLCIVATVILIARGGMQTVSGIVDLYGPIMIAIVGLLPIVVFKDFDLGYIKPYFYVDWIGVSKGSWMILPYLGQILALPFIFTIKDYRFRHGLYALFIATVVMVLLMMMILLLVGVPISESLMFPSYELTRQVQITDFLDRFDLLLVALWFPAALLNVAISLYIICYGLKTMIPPISGKMMTSPIGLLAFSCAFWFYPNSIELFKFNHEWSFISMLFIVVLPILIFIIHRPVKMHKR